MQDQDIYDYAIIRVLPRVEREEFINVGVVLSCPTRHFLEARIVFDAQRLLAVYPAADVEVIRKHLDAFLRICAGGVDAGPIGQLSQRERFHWLVAPRSTMIQTSPVHTGSCTDPSDTLNRLVETMVQPVLRR